MNNRRQKPPGVRQPDQSGFYLKLSVLKDVPVKGRVGELICKNQSERSRLAPTIECNGIESVILMNYEQV